MRSGNTSKKIKVLTPVFEITPFTMLDYEGYLSCIIWFSGCNMRCPYCHNPQIVKSKGITSIEDTLDFLYSRKGLLEAVILCGGESTLYPELEQFIQNVKEMGYKVKLDTNGTRPETVYSLLKGGWLDYIALDYKAPESKFREVTGAHKYKEFKKTLELLCAQESTPFEVRTTVHTDLLNEQDILIIIEDLKKIKYKGVYYIQNYINNGGCTLGNLPPQKRELKIKEFMEEQPIQIKFRNFT